MDLTSSADWKSSVNWSASPHTLQSSTWKTRPREVTRCFGIVSGLITKGNDFKGRKFSVYDILVVTLAEIRCSKSLRLSECLYLYVYSIQCMQFNDELKLAEHVSRQNKVN